MYVLSETVTETPLPKEIPFHTRTAFKYLRIRKSSPRYETLSKLVESCAATAFELIEPRYRYLIDDIRNTDAASVGVHLENGNCFHGAGLYKHLRHAPRAAFFVATIGDKIERELEHLARTDFTRLYVLDGVASAYVQGLVQLMEQQLSKAAKTDKYRLSQRFSPGYHNWDLKQQTDLLKMLDAQDLGLKLSPTYYMLPQKSLSGVYGFTRTRK